MALTPLAEVQQLVLASCETLPAERVALADALGLVLAEQVVAPESTPPFANSAMDGYAVIAADTAMASEQAPSRLSVLETIAAGHAPSTSLGPGQAARIMTGAPLPAGADAVVMVENTSPAGGGGVSATTPEEVLIRVPARGGDHVRGVGSDIAAGTLVFETGTELGPAQLGVLASLGIDAVRAHRRPVVGVLSTGDELVDGGGELRPGQIRDSNRRTLLATVAGDGFEAVDLGIARDDEAVVRNTLAGALERCDAILTSGGVSVGDFDYVKVVLDKLAAERGGFMRSIGIAIRPAKPFAFGLIEPGRRPVFGLPGNPVSSIVSYELLARPALRLMAGRQPAMRRTIRAVAGEDFGRHPDGKLHLLRVVATFGEDGRLVAAVGRRPGLAPVGGDGHSQRLGAVAGRGRRPAR